NKKNQKPLIALLLAVALVFGLDSSLSSARAQTQGGLAGHSGHGGAPPESGRLAPATPAAADPWAEFEEKKVVEIPVDKQQLIGVKTATASVQPLHRLIRTIGRIEYDERRLTTVNTKIEGWIEKLYINATGDFVKTGAPVAEIYSPELYATQQEFLNVLQWTRKDTSAPAPRSLHYGKDSSFSAMLSRDADSMLEAARQRLRLWDIAPAQIAKIERTGTPIRTLTIASPVSGYVLQKPALQGMRVMAGEKLLDLIDLSTVWVVADIYEYDLPFVKTGQKATINLSYFAGKTFESTIDFLYPTLAGETRTAKARFTIANPGGELKPQMYSDVEIFIDLGEKLAIPESAVINTGNRRLVYVDTGGAFEPREVTTGIKAEGMIEVTEGITAGDKVAVEANFLIDSEARLKGLVQ
ncbi:MAG: Efflux transporter, RND family, MFP subunit, partial [uncultured bacterium]